MQVHNRANSGVEYGRKLLNSGLEGARSGREAFLNGRPLAPFLRESAGYALTPAAIGACIGVLGGSSCIRRRSAGRTLACGVLGGVIGFGVGVAWESRRLTASVTASALRNMSGVRDVHWLERHPIDYA